MRRLALALVVLAGCAHALNARSHASAHLLSLDVVGSSPGQLQLRARYQLEGLPYGTWRGDSAQLALSLDDVPFAALVSTPRILPGDVVEVPVGLAFASPPHEVAAAWDQGLPIAVRLRGPISLATSNSSELILTDVQTAIELPRTSLAAPRG